MPRYVCQYNGRWFEWSTVVDAPVTFGMTREEFIDYYNNEYSGRDLESRMERAEQKGTSSMMDSTLEDLITSNRAGYNENHLTLGEIERIYLIEKRNAVEGEGTKMWHEDDD
jgi:hypothetical protein